MKSDTKAVLAMSVLMIALFTIGMIKVVYFMHPKRHIKSPAYIAVRGCAVKRYATAESISPSCMSPNYLISHDTARSYDWMTGRDSDPYFRIGDDAYKIYCYRSNSCTVDLTQYDAFAR